MKRDYTTVKVITTILVVLAHVTRFYTIGGGVIKINYNFFLHYVTSFIYSFHMPLFICVSGAIFSFCVNKRNKYKEFDVFVLKKIKRLMIPYFVFGIFWVTPVMYILKLTDKNPQNYIWDNIILSFDARHLWFLWTLFVIFVLFWCAFQYLNSEKANIFLGILLFLMAMISNKVPQIFQIQNICYYSFFFWVGYVFDKKKEQIDQFLQKKKWLLVLEWAFISFVVLYTYNRVLNLITAIFGMLFLYQIAQIIGKNISEFRLYKVIEKNSMGIYLFHPMIIYLLFYYFKKNCNNYPIISCIIIFGISTLLSLLLSKIVRKLRMEWLIGG